MLHNLCNIMYNLCYITGFTWERREKGTLKAGIYQFRIFVWCRRNGRTCAWSIGSIIDINWRRFVPSHLWKMPIQVSLHKKWVIRDEPDFSELSARVVMPEEIHLTLYKTLWMFPFSITKTPSRNRCQKPQFNQQTFLHFSSLCSMWHSVFVANGHE